MTRSESFNRLRRRLKLPLLKAKQFTAKVMTRSVRPNDEKMFASMLAQLALQVLGSSFVPPKAVGVLFRHLMRYLHQALPLPQGMCTQRAPKRLWSLATCETNPFTEQGSGSCSYRLECLSTQE